MAYKKWTQRVVQLSEKDRSIVNYLVDDKWFSVTSERVGSRNLWRTEVNGILVLSGGHDLMLKRDGIIEAKKLFLTKSKS